MFFTIIPKVVPALAAGCCIVLKPSELAPLSCLLLAELATEAGTRYVLMAWCVVMCFVVLYCIALHIFALYCTLLYHIV